MLKITLVKSTIGAIPKHRKTVQALGLNKFTNDAAAEMKQRLQTAFEKRIAEEPENRWLRQQQLLLPAAKISTIIISRDAPDPPAAGAWSIIVVKFIIINIKSFLQS